MNSILQSWDMEKNFKELCDELKREGFSFSPTRRGHPLTFIYPEIFEGYHVSPIEIPFYPSLYKYRIKHNPEKKNKGEEIEFVEFDNSEELVAYLCDYPVWRDNSMSRYIKG